jgi:hypothetical protein
MLDMTARPGKPPSSGAAGSGSSGGGSNCMAAHRAGQCIVGLATKALCAVDQHPVHGRPDVGEVPLLACRQDSNKAVNSKRSWLCTPHLDPAFFISTQAAEQ